MQQLITAHISWHARASGAPYLGRLDSPDFLLWMATVALAWICLERVGKRKEGPAPTRSLTIQRAALMLPTAALLTTFVSFALLGTHPTRQVSSNQVGWELWAPFCILGLVASLLLTLVFAGWTALRLCTKRRREALSHLVGTSAQVATVIGLSLNAPST